MKSTYSSYTDIELVGLMQEEDNSAFAVIYDRYFGPIYAFVRKMLQDGEHAEVIHKIAEYRDFISGRNC